MASNYYVIYPDELYHHGVKGMKWGVRKAVDTTNHLFNDRGQSVRNVLKYGWRQGHGKNVYRRLNEVKNNKTRMSRMNTAQKQSLTNATKYWKNRAEGKGIYGSGRRNLIKRSYDASRSHAAGERFVSSMVFGVGMSAGDAVRQGGVGSLGSLAVSTAANTGSSMLGDEFVNKLFGHF